MYILIFEDGSMVKSKTVSDEDFKAADDGLVDIIDVGDDDPMRYFDSGWTDIDTP